MLASALTIGFIFLINRNDLDVRVGVEAALGTFVTLGIVHSARVPWLLVKRMSEKEKPLSWPWGILGMGFFCAFIACSLYAATWFYTMQPRVTIEARTPDGRDIKIRDLERQNVALHNQLPDERSLKVRLLEAAQQFNQFWRHYPKGPTCTQTNSMTPEVQRKVMEPCNMYLLRQEEDYQLLLAPRIMALVAEFKAKGGNVSNIENCAAAGYCGIPLVVQLKAFSAQLTAQDSLKGSSCFN